MTNSIKKQLDILQLETDYPDCYMTEHEAALQANILKIMHNPCAPQFVTINDIEIIEE